MALKLIPCAALYRMELPPAEALEKHLAALPFEELQPHMPSGHGFVKVEPSDDLVYEFTGGLAFALRIDEKVVPASVVRAEVKKWIANYTEQEEEKPSRKAIVEAKERIVASLTARALSKTKVVVCLYHTASKTLIVPALGRNVRDRVTSALVRAVESIKVETIYVSEVKGSLTARLTSYIVGDGESDMPFGDFIVGNKVVMVGPESKSTFDLSDDLSTVPAGIQEAITIGAGVSEIALSHNGVAFRLTQDFMLKSIKFQDGAIEYEEDSDPHYVFEHEAAAQLLLVANVVDALCEMFGYTPPADDGTDLT